MPAIQANERDQRHLERTIDLAGEARGRTGPNPLVGAVVVKSGRVIGGGFHAAAGSPHAERVARRLEERHPGLVTTEWLKRKREGVLVDHRQNARGKTIASVYSVRPKPGAPVSTPLRWDELTEDLTARRFGMPEALERVELYGDLFAPVLTGGQALGRALKRLG